MTINTINKNEDGGRAIYRRRPAHQLPLVGQVWTFRIKVPQGSGAEVLLRLRAIKIRSMDHREEHGAHQGSGPHSGALHGVARRGWMVSENSLPPPQKS